MNRLSKKLIHNIDVKYSIHTLLKLKHVFKNQSVNKVLSVCMYLLIECSHGVVI